MWRRVLIQCIVVNIRFLPNIFQARAGNGFLRFALTLFITRQSSAGEAEDNAS